MTKLVVSNKFKRAVRKFARRDGQLQARIEETLIQMSLRCVKKTSTAISHRSA